MSEYETLPENETPEYMEAESVIRQRIKNSKLFAAYVAATNVIIGLGANTDVVKADPSTKSLLVGALVVGGSALVSLNRSFTNKQCMDYVNDYNEENGRSPVYESPSLSMYYLGPALFTNSLLALGGYEIGNGISNPEKLDPYNPDMGAASGMPLAAGGVVSTYLSWKGLEELGSEYANNLIPTPRII